MRTLPLLLLFFLVSVFSAQEYTDAVLAKVGEKVFTALDVRMASAQEESMLPDTLSPQEREDAVLAIRSRVLDEMILEELVWMDFQELKGRIPREYLQSRVDQIIRRQANSDEERFRDMLHQQGTTYQEFEDNLRRQLGAEMLLYDRTRRNIFITTEEIQSYFQAHKKDFAKPRRIHVQEIMLKKEDGWEKRAREIVRQLQQGKDFAELAREFSQDGNAQNGGDMGWQEELAPALEEAVGKLRAGRFTRTPVELGNGAYLLKVVARDGGMPSKITPEIQKEIKDILTEEAAQKKKEEYIKTLSMKFPVRRY